MKLDSFKKNIKYETWQSLNSKVVELKKKKAKERSNIFLPILDFLVEEICAHTRVQVVLLASLLVRWRTENMVK